MSKALKMGVLLALGVTVAVCVLGVVAYQYQQRQLRESPFLQELNSLIQRKEFGAVTQRLVEKAPTVDKSEGRLIATWLKGHAVDGDFPALYFTSLYHTKQGRLDEAGKWYSAAALVARVDAARCSDASAAAAPRVIEALFSTTKSFLNANPGKRSAAARWAFEYEEKNKERPVAGWIAKHGSKAFSGNVQYVPDADWQAARSRIRAEFGKLIAAN
jgi:hypothetical protein